MSYEIAIIKKSNKGNPFYEGDGDRFCISYSKNYGDYYGGALSRSTKDRALDKARSIVKDYEDRDGIKISKKNICLGDQHNTDICIEEILGVKTLKDFV